MFVGRSGDVGEGREEGFQDARPQKGSADKEIHRYIHRGVCLFATA